MLSSKTKLLNILRKPLTFPVFHPLLHKLISNRPLSHPLAKIVPTNTLFPKGKAHTKVSTEGNQMLLDPSDYMEWLAYFDPERPELDVFKGLLKPGQVVLDIGANIGENSLVAASMVMPGGSVYAFEPNPPVFAKLDSNIRLNPNLPVKPIQKGIGEKPGYFYVDVGNPNNAGGGQLVEASASGNKQKVEVVALDAVVADLRIARVDIIKIDVEGFEPQVLRGGKETLQKHHPLLFIEFNETALRRYGSSTQELLQLLKELGYSSFERTLSQNPLKEEDLSPGYFEDIVCR